MSLARRYRSGKIATTINDFYRDRLTRRNDITEYLPRLYAEAAGRVRPQIVELGVRRGNSTVALLAGAERSGGHVWSVDIADVLKDRSFYGAGVLENIPGWTFIHGDDTDPDVLARIPEHIDVLFLDTTHFYEETLQELALYMPRVSGVALFHDTKYFPSAAERDWRESIPPVRKALDEWCAAAGLGWEEIDGSMGLGVISL